MAECEDWPEYSRTDVEAHTTKSSGIWMIYKNSVYDVTELAEIHVWGGDAFMEAAGKSIEPFWQKYPVHN